MRTVGLDTSVVLRLLTGTPEPLAAKAISYLDQLRIGGIKPQVCDLVLLETYFALQHHYRLDKAEAIEAIRAFVSSGEIGCDESARAVLESTSLHSAKPGLADRLIHARYIKECGAMATFERAAQRLPNVAVIG